MGNTLTEKEINDFSLCVKESLNHIKQLNEENKIPNKVMLYDNRCQFNVRLGNKCQRLIMNFDLIEHLQNSYLFNFTTFFPQDDYYYPENSTDETMLFKLQGAPFSLIYNESKVLNALNMTNAIALALDYVELNIGKIIDKSM